MASTGGFANKVKEILANQRLLTRECRQGHSGKKAETRAQGGRPSATESSKEAQQEGQGQ